MQDVAHQLDHHWWEKTDSKIRFPVLGRIDTCRSHAAVLEAAGQASVFILWKPLPLPAADILACPILANSTCRMLLADSAGTLKPYDAASVSEVEC